MIGLLDPNHFPFLSFLPPDIQPHHDRAEDQEAFDEEEGQLIAEMNSLLKQLEEIRMRHSGLFYLLEAGVLSQILEGRKIADFSGPYRAEIYFYVAEISSVSADVVKIQHQVKIELVRLSLEGFRTGWLV